MLHDRLVVGINKDSIQQRLLSETTFNKSLVIAQGLETAVMSTKCMATNDRVKYVRHGNNVTFVTSVRRLGT